jgi:UDP-glucose 6-dehydrogenase
MRISVIGTGYVGAVTGTCLANILNTRKQPGWQLTNIDK